MLDFYTTIHHDSEARRQSPIRGLLMNYAQLHPDRFSFTGNGLFHDRRDSRGLPENIDDLDRAGRLAGLKNESRTQGIPVLIVSTLDDQAKGYHLGARDYLVKPIHRAELVERLRAALGPSSPAHVLIIDDDERDVYLIRKHLRGSRLYVTEAPNGAQGIRQACEETPQGIILDLNMPGMNGFEVLERLKAEPATKDIPVVVCSSRSLTQPERLQLSEKAVAVLSKESLNHAVLGQALNRIFTPSGATAVASQ